MVDEGSYMCWQICRHARDDDVLLVRGKSSSLCDPGNAGERTARNASAARLPQNESHESNAAPFGRRVAFVVQG